MLDQLSAVSAVSQTTGNLGSGTPEQGGLPLSDLIGGPHTLVTGRPGPVTPVA